MGRLVGAALALLLLAAPAACSDDSPPAVQQQSVQEVQGSTAPAAEPVVTRATPQSDARTVLSPRWTRDDWRPLAQVLRENAMLAVEIDAEIEWCKESFALGDEAPRTVLLDLEDAPWVRLIAEATAEARGIALDRMPAIWISTPQSLHSQSCRSVIASRLETNPEQPSARWYWHLALGLIEVDWGPSVLSHLTNLDTRGWYLPQPAVGSRPDASAITLFLNDPPSLDAVATLSHEIVHHLQHQIMDGEERRSDTDSDAVLHWLLETDAMIAMLGSGDPTYGQAIEMLREAGGIYQPGMQPLFGRFPSEMSDWRYHPYRRAEEFVERLRSGGGPDWVDELLRDLPDSMEQLLHAEKYDSREAPLDLSPLQPLIDATVPGEEWRRVGAPLLVEGRDQDTLGEYYLQLLIAASTGREAEAAVAAAGWGGDRLHVFQRGVGEQADTLAVWAIAFDDVAEHAEGVAGLREWLIAYSDGGAWATGDARVIGWDGPAGAIRLLDHLDTIWVLVAGGAAIADDLAVSLLGLQAGVEWW